MGVSLHWHPHPFTSILAPAHSDLVLTGGEEGVVVLWYPNSQQPGFIPRVAPAITHMAVSADGVRLVVCGNDNALRFVEVSQKKVRVAITGLGLGALPSTAPIARIARAGLAFDQRSQELLVAMPGNSALLQRYDAVRDRQCGVVGEVRVETARTRHHDARGFRRVDLQHELRLAVHAGALGDTFRSAPADAEELPPRRRRRVESVCGGENNAWL